VAAVVFSPDRAARRSRRRTGLVLGAGGVLGAAWMTGALACLQDRLPCAVGDVDVIVGTSAGSVLAAALRCHAPVEEMIAWQRGRATGILSESVALAARDGPLPPLPRWRVGSVRLALATVLTPYRVPPWVGACAWLPSGRGQHVALRSLVGALHRRHHQQAARENEREASEHPAMHTGKAGELLRPVRRRGREAERRAIGRDGHAAPYQDAEEMEIGHRGPHWRVAVELRPASDQLRYCRRHHHGSS